MTDKAKLITAKSSESIMDVMKKIDKNKVRHIPVMDNEKLAGIISITDVISELLELNMFENEQLKNYILSPY